MDHTSPAAPLHPQEWPASSVPAAFDDGHLYSPDAQAVASGIEFRPGSRFPPVPEAAAGDLRARAAWWRTEAGAAAPDFLGLKNGDVVTVRHGQFLGPATVVSTCRSHARAQYALRGDPDGPKAEVSVSRRSPQGHWYS